MTAVRKNYFTWSKHPKETAWLLEYCKGNPSAKETADAFEKEFGIRLTKAQILNFRRRNGIRKEGARTKTMPIGSERLKDGYVYVKVADDLGFSGNWKPKNIIVWEEANGRPLPDDHKIIFIDGDKTNCDLDNLMAVDKKRAAILPRLLNAGATYNTREELETLLTIGELERCIVDARTRPKTCRVCGKTFVPDRRNTQASCKECRDAGRRASSWEKRKPVGRGVCDKCGKAFDKNFANQKRCGECSAKGKGRKEYEAWKRRRGL